MLRPALPCLLAVLAPAALADPLPDSLNDRAVAAFSAAFADSCMAAFAEDGSLIEPPRRFDVTMPWSVTEPEQVTLWQFRCNIGAYNLTDVFLLRTEFDGIVPLALAQPAVAPVNEDPEDFESPVREITVTGWTARSFVVNGSFDPATGLLSATGYWRGIGDAYDAGAWVLRDGGFQLRHYEVDASYDGEARPQLVMDFP
ncbi:hypothetical protein G5B31_05040 [Rhodobacter sp. SGA-6-6]|uniref:hypothetical protein n=1 Tax=Rhodobacter sp. SGA-6-6 TaxID=2710882 RepID=UPI0013ED0BB7|nr:hypothetical protein [Rhodobacter sp. SGA-6-6]NGM44896.1 hypothetical protein [Rhodobacter sp. SGA-6-6]